MRKGQRRAIKNSNNHLSLYLYFRSIFFFSSYAYELSSFSGYSIINSYPFGLELNIKQWGYSFTQGVGNFDLDEKLGDLDKKHFK